MNLKLFQTDAYGSDQSGEDDDLPEVLVSNTEIIGTLASVKDENNKTKLVFTICKEIEIPESAIPREKLEGFIGERIGVFNCDGEYRIRKIRRR